MHEGRGIQDTMTLSVLHISDLHRDPANPIGCSAPGSLDTSLSHAAGLIEIAACHA